MHMFYSIKQDSPEHIVCSRISLSDDWEAWKVTEYASVIQPERDYEGADLPLIPSESGAARTRVRQLRDPAIYEEDGKVYLLYSIAGERGIAMAQLGGLND